MNKGFPWRYSTLKAIRLTWGGGGGYGGFLSYWNLFCNVSEQIVKLTLIKVQVF